MEPYNLIASEIFRCFMNNGMLDKPDIDIVENLHVYTYCHLTIKDQYINVLKCPKHVIQEMIGLH